MTVHASDTFTDTDGVLLNAHTPNTGGPWHDDSVDPTIQGGKLQCADFAMATAYCDSSLATPDYDVSADVSLSRLDFAGDAGVFARRQVAGNTGYIAAWETGAMQWQIWVNGVDKDILATSSAAPLGVGVTRNLTLRCNADRISLLVDGSELAAVNDSTYTATDRAGVYLEPVLHDAVVLDNFLLQDVAVTPPPVLTGRGSITLFSPAWIQVVVTGLAGPATFGNAEPHNWYGVALLSWGTSEGLLAAHPVTREIELIPLPDGMTVLYYWVASGLSITVTERSTP